MTWRCSLTSNLRQGALIFVGFHNIFLFWLQALFWKGPGIFVGKKCLKMSKKSSIWSPFLARGLNDVALRWTNFSRVYFLCPFCVKKCPLRYLFFAWTSWSILVPSLRAFGQEIWNGLKLYSQSSTVFQKKCHKNEKCCFQYSQMT